MVCQTRRRTRESNSKFPPREHSKVVMSPLDPLPANGEHTIAARAIADEIAEGLKSVAR